MGDIIQLTIAIVLAASLLLNLRQIKTMEHQNNAMERQIKAAERQTKAAEKSSIFDVKLKKISKSLSYSLSKSEDLRDIRRRLDEVFGSVDTSEMFRSVDTLQEPIALEKLQKIIENTERVSYSDITTLLGHWENLALAINRDIADDDVAFEMVSGVLMNYVRIFQCFIDQRRKEHNSFAYSHLLKLNQEWNKKRDERLDTTPKYEPLLVDDI